MGSGQWQNGILEKRNADGELVEADYDRIGDGDYVIGLRTYTAGHPWL